VVNILGLLLGFPNLMMVIWDENGRKVAEEKFTIPEGSEGYSKDIHGCDHEEVTILLLI